MTIINVSLVLFLRQNGSDDWVWLQKRKTKDQLEGKWEFPGGKIEVGESPVAAACREVEEEVGIQIQECDLIPALEYLYEYGNLKINFHVFRHHMSDQDQIAKMELEGEFILWKKVVEWCFDEHLKENIPRANQEWIPLLKWERGSTSC